MSSMTTSPDPGPAHHLWVDASAGVAGDMLLGALVDAGADLAGVQAAVDTVLPGTVLLETATVTRAGLRALKVDVRLLVEDQPHRTWREIRSLLTEAALPEQVRQASLTVFGLLAEAEARVHGVQVDEVHFHEVGAWDSIADVLGVVAAVDLLGVTDVTASAVALGSGRTRTAHGDVPVPAPATLQLSTGWPVLSGGEGELATPTGMALVRGLASASGDLPPLQVDAVGVGAGSKDTPGRPNVVRVVRGPLAVAEPAGARTGAPAGVAAAGHGSGLDQERLLVLEANVDDLDPRVWPEVLALLLDAGAADAWLTPILMKKGRPAHTLSVLCHAGSREGLRELVFRQTTTFGIREHPVARTTLRRDWRPVSVRGHTVRVKISTDVQGEVLHATPEFEDALSAARACALPVRQVLDEAAVAAAAAGIVPGVVPPGSPTPA
ncbi:nickel pincer cofactor biosynthesis protein LarC [Pedococcus sp. 5OH_020]|uniref:nickel pincer cofactor biosynthesis protein LarC n=1 Tax=Pedococcus sp. 5OH_020 TaxID=2989814 RepID=UPI0022E99945|nr:nickel pincer cofactor biosynthesis protein LarC [Pedococcus sp. 5OH_020]